LKVTVTASAGSHASNARHAKIKENNIAINRPEHEKELLGNIVNPLLQFATIELLPEKQSRLIKIS